MLLVVLLTATFLADYCDSECYDDITKLRCWCRDDDDRTIMRVTHEKHVNNIWSIEYNITNGECSDEEIISLFPPDWCDREDEDIDEDEDKDIDTDIKPVPGWVTEKGYQLIGNSFYKLHVYGTYWDDARRTCLNEGTHLAIINSEPEAVCLAVLIKNSTSLIQHVEESESVFIGFHDMFEEGEFITIFGQPLRETGFNNWATNKPDNRQEVLQGMPGNDCGGLFINGKLTDLGCDWFHAFICEFELSDYKGPNKIDYTNSSFTGIELIKPPEPGKKVRREPGLGYKLYPGFSFYRYHTTPVIWEHARAWCERDGAYLAIVNSQQELNVLHSIIKEVPVDFIVGTYKNRYTFLGYHCLFEARKFVTLFNRTLEEEGAGKAILNNIWASPQYVAENCLSIDKDGIINDIGCHMNLAFMCEKDVVE